MAGIEQTKEVVRLGVSVGEAVAKAFEDKQFTIPDVRFFFPVLMKLRPALDGVVEVPKEMGDLSDEERAELVAEFSKLDIPNDKVEEAIKSGFEVALHLIQLAKLFIKPVV